MTTRTSTLPAAARPLPLLNIGLWSVQILLAVAFGMAGMMKTTTPIAELAQAMPWAGAVPGWLVRVIGASELAGAIGLIVPAALRILPLLTPIAASGLITIMLLAMPFHLSRGEASALAVNIPLAALRALRRVGPIQKDPEMTPGIISG